MALIMTIQSQAINNLKEVSQQLIKKYQEQPESFKGMIFSVQDHIDYTVEEVEQIVNNFNYFAESNNASGFLFDAVRKANDLARIIEIELQDLNQN